MGAFPFLTKPSQVLACCYEGGLSIYRALLHPSVTVWQKQVRDYQPHGTEDKTEGPTG